MLKLYSKQMISLFSRGLQGKGGENAKDRESTVHSKLVGSKCRRKKKQKKNLHSHAEKSADALEIRLDESWQMANKLAKIIYATVHEVQIARNKMSKEFLILIFNKNFLDDKK